MLCPLFGLQAYGKFDNGAELLAAKTRKASRAKAGKPQRRNVNQISAENQDKWFVGKQQREACHAAVLGGNFGDFVVREGTKPGTCVIVINDSGIIANLQVKINTGNGNCTLAGQNYQGMDDVIDYLRANPQNSKKEGSPKYVAQPTLRGTQRTRLLFLSSPPPFFPGGGVPWHFSASLLSALTLV